MKRFIIFFAALLSVCYGQFQPSSNKINYKLGIAVGTQDSTKYNVSDSLVVVINRAGRMMYRSTDGYWKILSNVGSSDFVPYTGANQNVTIGNYRVSTRTLLIDSVMSRGSGGSGFYTNSAGKVFTYGAGGSTEVTFYGFAGYDANRSSSYTARSFTDKKYVDSSDALRPIGNSTQGRIAYWGGANQLNGNANLFWDNATSRMGIRNSAAPLAPLHVGNRNENSSVDPVILVSREIDNTTTGNGHGFSDASRFLRSGGVAYNSFDGRINIAGANNYDHYVAFQHAPYNTSTGTIQYVSGLATVTNTDAGTIVRNSGVYVLNPIGSGTITNNYGILIDPLAKGLNNFGVHSSVASGPGRWNFYALGTARNLFTGVTHIGDTTTYAGSPILSVTGKGYFSDSVRTGVITTGNLNTTGVGFFKRGNLSVILNPSYAGGDVYGQLQSSSSFAIATGGDNNRIFINATGSIGIDQTALTGNIVRATKSITGASASNGILFDGEVLSDVVSQASYFRSNVATQNTAFTLPSLNHFRASQRSIGASSTVTEQNGFFADNTIIGGVSNFGFRGQISSGTNRWNLYMDGTANNHIQGNTMIGTTSNPDNYKLIVSGGIFGSFASGSNYRLNGGSGGWDRKYAIFGSSGTDRGGFGALGGTDALTYYYIGQSSSDNAVRFDYTTKKADFYGNIASTGSAFFASGITAQRVKASSLVLNKDSVPISSSNVSVLGIDTITGQVVRENVSGVYTPTVSNISNVTSSSVTNCKFTKVGNIVTVTGVATVTPTTSASAYITVTLPIASDLTDSFDLTGIGNSTINLTSVILGDTASDIAQFQFDTGGISTRTYFFTFTYLIK